MKIIYILLIALFHAGVLSAQVDRSHEPNPDKPKEINLGDLKSIELENGLKVFLVPKAGYGKFAFSLTVSQPDIKKDSEPELRAILGKVYYQGHSQNYTESLTDSIIDFNGAKIGVTINGGFVIGLHDNLNELMDLYTDQLFNPSITNEDIRKLTDEAKKKQEAKKTKKVNKREINGLRDFRMIVMDSLLNDGVRAQKETTKTAEKNYDLVTIKKLKEFQKERIAACNSTAILIGDFTPKSAERMLKKHFGKWQKGKEFVKEANKKTTPSFLKSRKIFVIDKPQSVQASVSFNWSLGDAYSYSEDQENLEVMNQILGGYTGSYIYANLREDKGLCYSAFSSISPSAGGGSGFIKTDVRTEKAPLAVENIIYEMLRIRNQNVSDKSLRLAQNSLIGAYARSLGGIALQRFLSFAMVKDDYNLPDDYLKTYPFHIGEVSKEDIKAMAIKYVKPNNCLIFVEGNAKELHGKLEQYGPVEYYTKEGKEIKF